MLDSTLSYTTNIFPRYVLTTVIPLRREGPDRQDRPGFGKYPMNNYLDGKLLRQRRRRADGRGSEEKWTDPDKESEVVRTLPPPVGEGQGVIPQKRGDTYPLYLPRSRLPWVQSENVRQDSNPLEPDILGGTNLDTKTRVRSSGWSYLIIQGNLNFQESLRRR